MTGWEWSPLLRGATRRGLATLAGLATFAVTPLAAQVQMAAQERQALAAEIQAAGGRVIVQVKPTTGPRLQANGRSAMAEQALATVQERLESRGLRAARRVNLVPLVFGEVTPDALDALLNDPNVLAVEPDVAVPIAEVSPRSFAERALEARMAESLPWGIDRVSAPQAWSLTSPALDGTGIKVAAMDTGGDMDHPDLRFAGGYEAATRSTEPADWDDDISVCNGHGTHVLGTIGASRNEIGVVGVAPGVDLYVIKVGTVGSSGGCVAPTSYQIDGLNWAVQQGIRVVSISIGGSTYVSSYEQAITAAAAAGTFVVAAAGNNGTSALTYPGRYADAIAVGATTSSNTRASWSNYGPDLDVVAPGVSIYSTMPGGGYGSKSGTSMATPHAAGVVALILDAEPNASRSTVLQRLRTGALDLGTAGWDDQFGHGLTRAYEAISGIGELPPPPPPVPLSLAVSPASRSASSVEGSSTTLAEQAAVDLAGDGSTTTGWTASKRKAWTTLTAASGTGDGTVKWSRNPAGLVAGTYVDTITVAAGSLTARVIDTLVITPAPAPEPLALSVSPGSRKVETDAGSTTAFATSATVSLSGGGSGTTAWTASKGKSWTTLTTASGTGSGTVAWTRSASGLSAGTYVDTITVAAGGLTARVIDTLVVRPPSPLTLSVTPKGRKASAKAGTSETIADSGDVVLTGTGSATATWSASRRSEWLNLLTVSGTGSAKIRWTRNTAGLAAGTYVDTITVTSAGALASPTTIVDTLVLTQGPGNGNGGGGGGGGGSNKLKTSPRGGKTTGVSNSTAGLVEVTLDSLRIFYDEENPPAFTWTATSEMPWLQFQRASGSQAEHVLWTRDTEGLPEGLHIGRITLAVTLGEELIELAFADTVIAGIRDPEVAEAGEDLFDQTRLAANQRMLLDQLGNRNGTYDLGDFLAWVERTSVAVPTTLMARVMTLPPTEPPVGTRRPDPEKKW